MPRKELEETIDALLASARGGCMLVDSDVLTPPVIRSFETTMNHYRGFAFWQRSRFTTYRPHKALWLPQRRAVQLLHLYLAAYQEGQTGEEAALVKMPTGTGKTGVIASVACLSPTVRRVLIITPRVALVRQMAGDLFTNFWRRFDAIFLGDKLEEGLNDNRRNILIREVEDKGSYPILTLLSSQYQEIWDTREADRQIIVGTFNAVHRALAPRPPAHRLFRGRSQNEPSLGMRSLRLRGNDADTSDREEEAIEGAAVDAFRKQLSSVDLVIVDEGHYEPAYSWRHALRQIDAPKVLFSATPYRNDYKYFEITGRFAFNLPHQEAVREKLIRRVKVSPAVGEKAVPFAKNVPAEQQHRHPQRFLTEIQFVKEFAETWRQLPEGHRVIVHAATFDSLCRLQAAFWKHLSAPSLLIHDRVSEKEEENAPMPTELKGFSKAVRTRLQALRFTYVDDAKASDDASDIRIWLHQFKLLEGIDDDRFTEVWLYDGFGTARHLIQQIGRAVRLPRNAGRMGAAAVVRGSSMPLESFKGAPTVAMQTERRWTEYQAYEEYAGRDPKRAFEAETQLVGALKRAAPDVQYIAGEFRGGHLLDDAVDVTAYQVPRRAVICRLVVDEDPDDPESEREPPRLSDNDLNAMAIASREAMVLEERFDIEPVRRPDENLYRDLRMIRYLRWNTSPYLISQHLPEWRLGVMLIVRRDPYVFLLDTEGLCLDPDRVRLSAPEHGELRRLFPRLSSRDRNGIRIYETSASGLDLGDAGVRALTLRRGAMESGYFDLSEAAQVPTSIRGSAPLSRNTVRRRVSFSRSSVSDATNKMIRISDYLRWTREVAKILDDQTVEAHHFFDRFAEEVRPPDEQDGAPTSILLDLFDLLDVPDEVIKDRRWNERVIDGLLRGDTLFEVTRLQTTKDAGAKPRFKFDLEFTWTPKGKVNPIAEKIPLEIVYDRQPSIPPRARYRIEDVDDRLTGVLRSDTATEEMRDRSFGRPISASLLRSVNLDQSFRIIPQADGLIYAHKHFYRPQLDQSLLDVIETCDELDNCVSEKGDTRLAHAGEASEKTVFGRVFAWFDGEGDSDQFAGEISQCDLLVCDDRGRERADFFALDRDAERIFVIHAKADPDGARSSARSLQDVGRQCLASLAFAGAVRTPLSATDTWDQPLTLRAKFTDGTSGKLGPYNRIRSETPLNGQAAAAEIEAALANPRCRREIIMLTSGLVSRRAAVTAFGRQSEADRQFLYFLASLRTAFSRAGVGFRIVTDP